MNAFPMAEWANAVVFVAETDPHNRQMIWDGTPDGRLQAMATGSEILNILVYRELTGRK